MNIKAASPECHLHIQDVRPAWTPTYQYLGVWVDHSLTITREATYLRKRIQARLNVRRVMTRAHTGATFTLLLLFQVEDVHTLTDCNASGFVGLSTEQRRKEVLQNRAMKIMLGSPNWASGCAMQIETRLVPLASRLQQIVACRVARILHQERESVERVKLSKVLPQW